MSRLVSRPALLARRRLESVASNAQPHETVLRLHRSGALVAAVDCGGALAAGRLIHPPRIGDGACVSRWLCVAAAVLWDLLRSPSLLAGRRVARGDRDLRSIRWATDFFAKSFWDHPPPDPPQGAQGASGSPIHGLGSR